MRVFRFSANTSSFTLLPMAAAIGNFDGIHLGHQLVIGRAFEHADNLGIAKGVITFEPHPKDLFSPSKTPMRITPFYAKARILEAMGVDVMVVVRFDHSLAGMEAADFVRDVLAHQFNVRSLTCGANFRFGQKRRGDEALLRKMGPDLGMHVDIVASYHVDDAPCSSSRIREALLTGKVQQAARLLGRPFTFKGRVRHGHQRGRSLGYPTANLHPGNSRSILPKNGIYAVTAEFMEGKAKSVHPAVASLGRNPTFDLSDSRLEVYLLDGHHYNLYERVLNVAFIEYLRDEMKFSSLEALKSQISLDCQKAREIHQTDFPAL